jgi:hypothetical protein
MGLKVLHPCSCDEYRRSSATLMKDERQDTSDLCHGEISLVRPLNRKSDDEAALPRRPW